MVWNPPGTKRREGTAKFGIRRDPYLREHVFGSFFEKLKRKIDLTNALKKCLHDNSFKQCSNIAGFLGVLGGRAHACARARASPRASEKLRATRFGTCRVPYHEALVRASGKDLALGQVALIDPI